MLAEPIKGGTQAAPVTVIERLNAVLFSPAQFQAALERLDALPVAVQGDPSAQALALQVYVQEATGLEDAAIVSAALHARIVALAKWTAAGDPGRQSNADAVIEAAARFPLHEGEGGIGFEAGGFQEMVLILEELPW